jgi:hypothetical protein
LSFYFFCHITLKKIKNIHINAPYYVYYNNFQLTFQYENFAALILHKTYFGCIRPRWLNTLFEFLIIFCHIISQKFMKIHTNICSYVYYKISTLTLQYKHSKNKFLKAYFFCGQVVIDQRILANKIGAD